MIVDCAQYRDGVRQDVGPLDIETAAERAKQGDGFVWLGLHEPGTDELDQVALQLHEDEVAELEVEDVGKVACRQRGDDEHRHRHSGPGRCAPIPRGGGIGQSAERHRRQGQRRRLQQHERHGRDEPPRIAPPGDPEQLEAAEDVDALHDASLTSEP